MSPAIRRYPFLENYIRFYFARHMMVKLLVQFFFKKVPFLTNMRCFPIFLDYALEVLKVM